MRQAALATTSKLRVDAMHHHLSAVGINGLTLTDCLPNTCIKTTTQSCLVSEDPLHMAAMDVLLTRSWSSGMHPVSLAAPRTPVALNLTNYLCRLGEVVQDASTQGKLEGFGPTINVIILQNSITKYKSVA